LGGVKMGGKIVLGKRRKGRFLGGKWV